MAKTAIFFILLVISLLLLNFILVYNLKNHSD